MELPHDPLMETIAAFDAYVITKVIYENCDVCV